MTDPELQGIAAQALNMAKRDMERGSLHFLVAVYHAGEGLFRMSKVETLITERLGQGWLNSGHLKDVGFETLRMCVDAMKPEAFVFAHATNVFTPSEKLRALPEEERNRVLNAKSHDEHHEFVRQGLLTIHDALTCSAQTAERVCMYTQKFDPTIKQFIGPPIAQFTDQAHFSGRLKMYGEKYGYGNKEARA
jgi:hypothetical protein